MTNLITKSQSTKLPEWLLAPDSDVIELNGENLFQFTYIDTRTDQEQAHYVNWEMFKEWALENELNIYFHDSEVVGDHRQGEETIDIEEWVNSHSTAFDLYKYLLEKGEIK